MSISPPHRLPSNRGGGCIEDFQIVPAPPDQHVLRLRAPVAVADQLRRLEPTYVSTIRQAGRLVLRGPGLSANPATQEMIDVLQGVLTLPVVAGVDYAIALDWTKRPIEGQDSYTWPNTPIGDLVHKGKYRYKDPAARKQLKQVGLALTAELSSLIDRHPLLRAADAIVAVPGHDTKVLSFGARLAASVAHQRGLRFVAARSLSEFRTPAKSLHLAERAEVISGQFVCDSDLRGGNVVIVDDLFSSGTTAAETARAIRLAGARQVAVLCAVRTLRSR